MLLKLLIKNEYITSPELTASKYSQFVHLKPNCLSENLSTLHKNVKHKHVSKHATKWGS